MLHVGTPLWQILVRTAVVYFAVFVGLRAMGKRQLGQMTLTDLVVIILIANAVQNAMVGPDTSLVGGLIAALTLLVLNLIVSRVRLVDPKVDRLVEGSPTMLIQDGAYLDANLRKEGVDRAEVESALREHGLSEAREAKLAYLEPDGSISIVPVAGRVTRSRRRVRQLRKH